MRHNRLPANFGKPWSEAEDKAIRDAFAAGEMVADIAAKHSRTQSSVRLRLEKLGAIESEGNEIGKAQ